MLHLDEGVVHELLDGELDVEEAETVRRHLAECGDCLRLYREAQEMVSEADRVIASLDDVPPELNEGFGPEIGLPAPPAANVGAGAPVVLMPTGVQAPRWRRMRPRNGIWAAALLLLAGGGYLIFRSDKTPEATGVPPLLATFPLSGGSAPSTDSLDAAADARATAALAARPPFGTSPAADSARDTASRKATRDSVTQLADAGRRASNRDTATDEPAATPTVTPPAAKPAAAKTSAPAGQVAASRTLAAAPPPERRPAARAEQTTADFSAADNAAPAREAAAAPAGPPTLDVQAQITTRIGLDDAKRALGTSLHAIDGLRPRLVGLVPGRLVPGADPSRDVVRAVYLDRNGQAFYLDQQRIGPNGPRRAGGIVKGDVQLFLNGNVPPDSARALEQRLR
jgi:hypothetical protein